MGFCAQQGMGWGRLFPQTQLTETLISEKLKGHNLSPGPFAKPLLWDGPPSPTSLHPWPLTTSLQTGLLYFPFTATPQVFTRPLQMASQGLNP